MTGPQGRYFPVVSLPGWSASKPVPDASDFQSENFSTSRMRARLKLGNDPKGFGELLDGPAGASIISVVTVCTDRTETNTWN